MNGVLEPTELLHEQLIPVDSDDRTLSLDERQEEYECYLRGEALLLRLLQEHGLKSE